MYVSSQEKSFSSLFVIFFIAATLLLSGCASNKAVESDVEAIEVEVSEVDPYEGFNRKMFVFNDTVDTYVAEPISDVYLWLTPRFVQTGVSNFFDNLKGINVFLNDFMQGKGQQGAEDTGRFFINSTLGLLGLFDVAAEFGLEKHDEDFAQTLAVWGVPQGPYLVLPLLGPSTGRGIPGGIFDAAANPATYAGAPLRLLQVFNAPVQLLQVLNARANADQDINFIEEASLDSYVFTRESFLQYRNNLIMDGQLENTDDLLDLDDEDFESDEVEVGNASEAEGIENNVKQQQDSLEKVVKSIDETVTDELDNSLASPLNKTQQ
jgi:phospholipid-binding lipoprotein MlaA